MNEEAKSDGNDNFEDYQGEIKRLRLELVEA